MDLKIREVERDENLAVLQKNVSIPNSFSFTTPSKSTKATINSDYIQENSLVNEVVRQVDERFLTSLETGSGYRITRDIQAQCKPNKLNLVIFNLTVDKFPARPLMRTFAQHLYASSDKVILLPTVKSSLFKETLPGRKTPTYSDAKFSAYAAMMSKLIDDIQSVGNNKVFMGTIPLLPIKYTRLLIANYLSKGIKCFAIDANTSDALMHETDLRAILSEINQGIPLSEAFIYACNLGFPRYEKNEARADDFLSLFAYIDVIGNTFKRRAVKRKTTFNGAFLPRLRLFSSDDYSYKLLESAPVTRSKLETGNQVTQLTEAHYVRDLLGQENLERYVGRKKAVDRSMLGRLEVIASGVRVK